MAKHVKWVTLNESYTLYEQKLKMLRLLEIILFYVHSKMVPMETIIIYPDSIFRYILVNYSS